MPGEKKRSREEDPAAKKKKLKNSNGAAVAEEVVEVPVADDDEIELNLTKPIKSRTPIKAAERGVDQPATNPSREKSKKESAKPKPATPVVQRTSDVTSLDVPLAFSDYRISPNTVEKLNARGISSLFPIQAMLFEKIYESTCPHPKILSFYFFDPPPPQKRMFLRAQRRARARP